MGRVPEELLPRESDGAGTPPGEERPGKWEERRGNEGFGGDEENDYDEDGEDKRRSVSMVGRWTLFPFPGDSTGVVVAGVHLRFAESITHKL